MARVSRKPWYRAQTDWWMVTFSGKQYKLVKGRSNKKLAEQKFLEFMRTATEAPESPDLKVHSACEFYLEWAANNLKPRTYEGQKWYLQSFAESCGPLRIDELRIFHVTQWLDGKKRWGETTRSNASRCVKRVFNWAVDQQILAKNPVVNLKTGRGRNRIQPMLEDNYLKLKRAASPELKLLLFVLKQTGARPIEIYNLTWDEVSAETFCIKDHKTARTKGSPRTIYLSRAMQRLMPRLQMKRKSGCEHVFLNTRGKPWNCNSVQLSLNRLRRKLGIKEPVFAYGLRHAYATDALLRGINTATVAELMGHADTTMVCRVYGHLSSQRKYLISTVNEIIKPVRP